MPQIRSIQNLMRPINQVGIVGYGAYVPRYRLPGREIARVWTNDLGGYPVKEKAVAGLDEDVTTMSIEAARNALARAQIDPQADPCRLGRQREPSLRRQADQHHRRREHRHIAQHSGGGLGIRLQSRDRSGTGFYRLYWQRHGALHAQYRHGYGPGTPRRRARIHGGLRWRGLPAGTRRRSLRGLPGQLQLRHRYTRFLAAARSILPGAWRPLHRRTGLLQPHAQRRAETHGHDGHDRCRLHLRRLPPAQRQIPNARREDPRFHAKNNIRPGCSPARSATPTPAPA